MRVRIAPSLSVLLVIASLLGAGVLIGRASGAGGQAPSDGGRGLAAAEALELVDWFTSDHPLERAAVLALRVDRIEHRPGYCTRGRADGEPGRGEQEYVVHVSARTLFGLPIGRFRAGCASVARYPHALSP